MRGAAAALLTLALAGCGGGGGGDSGNGPPAVPPPTGNLANLGVNSVYTGQGYGVTVYTPAGYASSTGRKAVIYALDHELQFGVIRETVETMGIDAIIVSVGNIDGNRRFVDFDLPGAEPYFEFLTLELIPQVEAQYRIDPARRSLMGYSLSGLMAVIALLEDQPTNRLFSGYVITDPSLQFHTDQLLAMEQRLWDTTHSLPLRAFHCATQGGHPWDTFPQQVAGRGYQGLEYHFQHYTLTHAAVLPRCVSDGLRYLFG
jgi:enterochelin esterase-like enzyme